MIVNKDVLIIGAGPAGMSAAIYLSRSKYTFSIIDKSAAGGKLLITTRIDNYPGVKRISGFDLANLLVDQLKDLNIKIEHDEIIDCEKNDKGFFVKGRNSDYQVKKIIISTGSSNKKTGLKNEENLIGKGISYCAVCDGFFYRNKEVMVFANETKGYLEALYLTDLVKTLYLVSDKDEDDSLENLKILKNKDNVIFYPYYKIADFIGDEYLTGVKIKSLKDGEIKTLEVEGCFPFEGDIPMNYFLRKLNVSTEKGYIVTDINMKTNEEGIYAAGDIVNKSLKQIVTACSDGAIAATNVIKSLNSK